MKAVFFDFDGTLLNTLPDVIFNLNSSLLHFGYSEFSDEEIKNFIGHGALNLISDCLGIHAPNDKKVQECLDYYNNLYDHSQSERTVPYDGIFEALTELRNRGYLNGIVSNKPKSTIEQVLSCRFPQFKFDFIIGGGKDIKLKPDPTETLKMVEKLDLDLDKCYFVGDAETDVQTAINAKMKGVSALWGYRTQDVLIEYGATVFAKSPLELLEIIK